MGVYEYQSQSVQEYESKSVALHFVQGMLPASLARHGCRMARHAARGHVQGSIFVPLSIVLFRANSREDIKSISDGLA